MENGIYKAKPLGAALGETSTGKEQVAIEFELTQEPFGRITYYGTFTDKATEHTLKALRVAGWRGEDLADLSSVGGDTAPEVALVVENEEYQGKWHSKVRWVNALGGLSMKNPLVGDKAKAFAARMKGAVLAFDKQAGTPKAPAPSTSRTGALSPEPPPRDNYDDIPF